MSIQKVKINFEHCYGIHKLCSNFDFSKSNMQLIYAPNGTMKTSFAKTFKDMSDPRGKTKPHDQLNETLQPTCKVMVEDDSGSERQITPDEIKVIKSYDESAFKSEEAILTLLANKEIRQQYVDIFKELDNEKKSALSPLKKITGSSNYEQEIIGAFSDPGTKKLSIFEVLATIVDDVKQSNSTFDFVYNHVFDPKGKVRDFLDENYDLLQKYSEKYNELLSSSQFFSNNGERAFGTIEAGALRDSIKGDEYFESGHKLSLKDETMVDSADKLSEIIDDEIKKVFDNQEIKDTFDKIDKKLQGNQELRNFKKVIEKDKTLIAKLTNYNEFRKEVWYSFLKQVEPGVSGLVENYNTKKPDIETIVAAANGSKGLWHDTVKEFMTRFTGLPFSFGIENIGDAILGKDMPTITYRYGNKLVDQSVLTKDILSQGERRAFYLLNVIFDIKSREKENKETLFIIDDIADSFDYKNKYAIIQYLNDLNKSENFKSIVLTHNFDFYRTLQERILASGKRDYSFIAERNNDEIRLLPGGKKVITDPFNKWRNKCNRKEKLLVAAIPFIRELYNYQKGNESQEYLLLTHLLHDKEADSQNKIPATYDIKLRDIEYVFDGMLNVQFKFPNKTKKVIDIIFSVADQIQQDPHDGISLENKIVLAMATRLLAEQKILIYVERPSNISKNQFWELYNVFRNQFGSDETKKGILEVLEQVNIITPANIHINSFMYEPIIDIGIDELVCLYDRVKALHE
jgi:conserved hypothetical protein